MTTRALIGEGADARPSSPIGKAERDIIALGIATASIIMFVGTGGVALPAVVRSLSGIGMGADKLLVNALLLNIALVIFGWRRYRQLTDEVSQRRKAEEQAKLLAETDPLTGCLNRRAIGPATDRLLAASSARGEIVAFGMIDLDNFKQVNDVNGHSIGDAILQETARRVSALLPGGALIARLGGDEFAFVVPFQPQRADQIDRLTSSIIDAMAGAIAARDVSIEVTVSIGLTRSDFRPIVDPAVAEADTLLHMADIAMYHAKKQGRNRYFWFEAPMESELRYRSELEAGIRKAVAAGEFVPFYEQQIDLATGELTGFEMLARWDSPVLGPVSPEIFIPIAEEIGVITELSEGLLVQAFDDAKKWNSSLTLSVNISPIQLRDPWFSQKLLKLLVQANFPAHRLEIEITESCLHENIALVRSMMNGLKNQGIRVSLDDFGTGYSSLAQLHSLPFDRIKIDRSFITSLPDSDESTSIVQAITALGTGLGLPVTAEGIETADVLRLLRGLGEYNGQGYLYGRPESADATLQRLAAMNLLAGQPAAAAPEEDTAPSRASVGRRARQA